MKDIARYCTEIAEKLLEASLSATKSKFADPKKYIGTQYDLIGLTVPIQRKAFKSGYSFNCLPPEEQLEIWDGIWKQSSCYEVLTQCIYFVEYNMAKLDPLLVWATVRHWAVKIDNWAHSDGLSDIFAYILERHPESVFPQYLLWNSSVNAWERRQTLVGLLYYSKKRKYILPAPQILQLITSRLDDPDYFVQKGLGWALRECGNVYPVQTMEFLETYAGTIHPAAFSAAIEKLSSEEKQYIKTLRKSAR